MVSKQDSLSNLLVHDFLFIRKLIKIIKNIDM